MGLERERRPLPLVNLAVRLTKPALQQQRRRYYNEGFHTYGFEWTPEYLMTCEPLSFRSASSVALALSLLSRSLDRRRLEG